MNRNFSEQGFPETKKVSEESIQNTTPLRTHKHNILTRIKL